MKTVWSGAGLVVLLVALYGCGEPPFVVQGTVVSYDSAAEQMVVRDETAPDRELVLSLTGADLGAPPAVGDVVRIAYREKGSELVALRVMTVSHESE